MNFEYLNKMIDYIEDNLTKDIDYKTLAKIVGISEYNLQRIFTFLTNISLSEYIRKRRLSKAFEELKNSNIKIIDLALKYKYDSQISFARVFKKYFGISPSNVKKSDIKYKLFPKFSFDSNNILKEISFEIKEIQNIKLYCEFVSAPNQDDLLYKIRELYKKVKQNGLYNIFNKNGMYGISVYSKENYIYYLGSKEKFNNATEFIIPKGKYAIFSVNSRQQKKIVEMEKIANNQFLNSTNYKLLKNFDFELYVDNNCFLYIMIEDKQNWF